MENQNDLILELKKMVIDSCNVKNCLPEDIDDTEQMIGGRGKLKLDSLDAVEIVMSIEKTYGIKIENPGAARKMMKSFLTLADFVKTNRTP
jgi:acyl carrier protein